MKIKGFIHVPYPQILLRLEEKLHVDEQEVLKKPMSPSGERVSQLKI